MPVAVRAKRWTLDELHRLPDDGNKYELVHGNLFVTPPPDVQHELILAKVARILDAYVAEHGLGYVYRPRSVIRALRSEVEPDLMVRLPHPRKDRRWERQPVPVLVVECISPSTRRRDHEQKRSFYMEIGVPDYWIIDPGTASITVVRADGSETMSTDRVNWHPAGASRPLVVEVAELFE
jgi:Uma2 family endonuclease